MTLEAELTIEPFVAGTRGPHVEAATAAARAAGLTVEVGPFGDRVSGEDHQVLGAVADMLRGAVSQGATRVSIQVTVRPEPQ
ncbi:MAG: thiamine-binding protein [Acidimicrobiales bacterium]